ncbi:MAG: PCRF domain-containing protein, partial [Deltaproteobacteria bacterium]|nr:PCRF domain-containing protein [Deltaproteobacteria bacterium]
MSRIPSQPSKKNSPPSGGVFDLDQKLKRIDELEAESGKPEFWNDSIRAKQLSKELDEAKATVRFFQENATKCEEAALMLELAEEAGDDESWKETEQKVSEAESALEEAEFRVMLAKEEDRLSAILTVNAGAGGTESCDWAAMLTRMYLRYCEKNGWSTQLIDSTEGEGAGYKSVTIT